MPIASLTMAETETRLIGSEFEIPNIWPARTQGGPDSFFCPRSAGLPKLDAAAVSELLSLYIIKAVSTMQDGFLSGIIIEARDVIISPS